MIATVVLATCSWAEPGHNPYRGAPAAAVDTYTDIPVVLRQRLKARMDARQYDEVVAIRRDSIDGYTDLRDMHFGRSTVCRQPDRSGWTDTMVERGLVYCEREHCLIVPTVCRNVSRVTRLRQLAPVPVAVDLEPMTGGIGQAGLPVVDSLASVELVFDAPSAGPAPAGASFQHMAFAQWQPPPWIGIGHVPVVSEPPAWLLALVGVAAILLWRKP